MTNRGQLTDLLRERLLPEPRSLTLTEGSLVWQDAPFALQLQGSFTADAHQVLAAVLKRLEKVPGESGADRSRSAADNRGTRDLVREVPLRVYCGGEAARDEPASEAYELEVTPKDIRLSSPTHLGVLRGTQTLAQILALRLPTLPCLHIADEPALAWRGVLIDVARHFIELPALLRTLDGMAHHKLNVLHLHLTDDQAFRFPSTAYPKLNAAGPFYTTRELRVLVSYAESLGIRVVPELDMPGHTTSWLAAYPEWSLYEVAPSERFGVHPGCLNPASEETYAVISALVAEFAAIFPDPCLHVGGDEVHPRWWQEHPDVQAFMEDHHFDSPRDLQAYFNSRIGDILAAHNKRMVVWDEALHESLPENALVHAWRGMTARDAAVARGHQCIVSSPYYLDLFFATDTHTQFAPLGSRDDALKLEDAMLVDERLTHVAGGLEWTKQWRNRPEDLASGDSGVDALAKNVIGAQACLWSELVDSHVLDVRLWSRLPLLAELFWRGDRPQTNYTRTAHSLRSWYACGGPEFSCVTGSALSRDQLDLLAPLGVNESLANLLSVLEPSKWYSRLLGADALAARLSGSEMPQARPYTTKTPLRSIACVISPQSFVSAELAELLERWNEAPLDERDNASLLRWVEQWRTQVERVEAANLGEKTGEPLILLADRLEGVALVLRSLHERFGGVRFDSAAAAEIERHGLGDQTSTLREQLALWSAPIAELMLAPAVVLHKALNHRLAASEPLDR